MARVSPILSSLNAGEISPLMEGRIDYAKYAKSLKLCSNFIPLVQGPVTNRPGTMHVSEVKDSSRKTAIIPFEFSTTQAYIIEFGHLYIRFYRDRGQILSGPSAYEIASPYTESDLFDSEGRLRLKFTQSADILYLAHPSYVPRKLSRTGHTSWTLTTTNFQDGPYLPTNATSTTLTLSATSGSVTVTASAALFANTDVGRLIRFQSGGTTWAWLTITAFTSATVVTATVNRSPNSAAASAVWRLGAWSATTGYPSCVSFYGDRQFWAGPASYPQRLDGSVVGDYENFAPTNPTGTTTPDGAVSFTLNSNKVNVIQWMIDSEKGLAVGTSGGEWIVRPSSLGEALTPDNINAENPTANGSASVAPIRADSAVLFIQRAGKKLRELAFLFEADNFRAPNITVIAEHITKTGITWLAYQSEPQDVVWAIRKDGTLIGLTYEREQEVLAWHRHYIGGSFSGGQAVVESIACIPSPDTAVVDLWMVVKRTINGSTKRYVEYLTELWEDGRAQADAFYVDSGLTYSGAPATVISGLSHLEGQTVTILADGGTHPTRVVSGGSITLARSASKVQIGLGYVSDGWTQRLEAGAQDGTAQGKIGRIHKLMLRLWQTLGGKVGSNANNLVPLVFRETLDPMGVPPPLFDGDVVITFPGGYERDKRIYFRQDQPLPFTLLAMVPQLATNDG